MIDGPLPGGLPKAVEVAVLADVADLSAYGIGVSYNGGASDGVDYALSGSAPAGTYLTISKESVEFENYFGSAPDFVYSGLNSNGDDAVELFLNGVAVDAYGAVGTDGSGTGWDYADGFAYRLSGSAGGGTAFDAAEWSVSGRDALDGCTSNGACGGSASFVPLGTYAADEGACECVQPPPAEGYCSNNAWPSADLRCAVGGDAASECGCGATAATRRGLREGGVGEGEEQRKRRLPRKTGNPTNALTAQPTAQPTTEPPPATCECLTEPPAFTASPTLRPTPVQTPNPTAPPVDCPLSKIGEQCAADGECCSGKCKLNGSPNNREKCI